MKSIILFLTLSALLLSSCSILPNRDFSSSHARWQNSHITHYRYSVHVGCFCPFTQRMPLTIEVSNGIVQSIVLNDGTPVPQDQLEMFSRYSTIGALFALTGDALRTADDVKVQYDAAYGFPSTVYIDYIRNAVDDELSLSVTNFHPLP